MIRLSRPSLLSPASALGTSARLYSALRPFPFHSASSCANVRRLLHVVSAFTSCSSTRASPVKSTNACPLPPPPLPPPAPPLSPAPLHRPRFGRSLGFGLAPPLHASLGGGRLFLGGRHFRALIRVVAKLRVRRIYVSLDLGLEHLLAAQRALCEHRLGTGRLLFGGLRIE
mmetsp:Transcript_14934/g.37771  ORF Transcript_14934/g.37771 Transcript_14934/m.37771 type:complete len:171 (+) Transcript_14934:310-822(+)